MRRDTQDADREQTDQVAHRRLMLTPALGLDRVDDTGLRVVAEVPLVDTREILQCGAGECQRRAVFREYLVGVQEFAPARRTFIARQRLLWVTCSSHRRRFSRAGRQPLAGNVAPPLLDVCWDRR